MKLLSTAALFALLALTGCSVGGAEIDCDDVDDDATCTCEDGSEGVIRCTSAFVDCICDNEGEDEWENMVPIDAGTTTEDTAASDTGDDADVGADAENATDADASNGDADASNGEDIGGDGED